MIFLVGFLAGLAAAIIFGAIRRAVERRAPYAPVLHFPGEGYRGRALPPGTRPIPPTRGPAVDHPWHPARGEPVGRINGNDIDIPIEPPGGGRSTR